MKYKYVVPDTDQVPWPTQSGIAIKKHTEAGMKQKVFKALLNSQFQKQ